MRRLELEIDAAKHLSQIHREAHLERRKLELRITFGPILVLFVAAATILVRGDAVRAHTASWAVLVVVLLATVVLVVATAMYLRRMHEANVANRLLAEAAEEWLGQNSVGRDWDSAKARIPGPTKTPNPRPWWIWQVAALSSAALVLLGVLFVAAFRNAPASSQTGQQALKSLSLDGGGVKLELTLNEVNGNGS